MLIIGETTAYTAHSFTIPTPDFTMPNQPAVPDNTPQSTNAHDASLHSSGKKLTLAAQDSSVDSLIQLRRSVRYVEHGKG